MDEGEQVQMLACVLAAAVHDVGHPGSSNGFQVANMTPYAIKWNNQKVLENHSVHLAFTLLKREELNFTADWSMSNFQQLRKHMISLVLATDFADHFDYITKLKTKVDSSDVTSWGSHEPAEQLLILQVLLKVADLGHCAAPLQAHKQWVERLQAEYFAQGDLERRNDVTISALCDRSKAGVNSSVSQLGFYDVVVLPLFSAWVERFPGAAPLAEQAHINRRYWQDNSSGSEPQVIVKASNRNLRRRSDTSTPESSGRGSNRKARSKSKGSEMDGHLPPLLGVPELSTYIDVSEQLSAPSMEERSFQLGATT